jgi:uncharacterized protein (TIGR02145 family)
VSVVLLLEPRERYRSLEQTNNYKTNIMKTQFILFTTFLIATTILFFAGCNIPDTKNIEKAKQDSIAKADSVRARINMFDSLMVKDLDGNVYHTVKIGTQTWLAENLKVTHYSNGDAIPTVIDSKQWSNLTTGAYCNYNDDTILANTYGRLYNWYAVIDKRNIAPKGWHLPSLEEVNTLIKYLAGKNNAGCKMKESGTNHWEKPNEGATNESGFTALPGGLRINRAGSSDMFFDIGHKGYFWIYRGQNSYFFIMESNNCEVNCFGARPREHGLSVRCIKD